MKTFWLILAISLFASEVYSMGNIGYPRTSDAKTIVLIDSVDNRISVETHYDNYELWEFGVSPTDFLIKSRMGIDTTCIFSSVGMTRFTTSISEECSSITVFCYPEYTDLPDEGVLLIEDFPRGSDDMFPLRFDFSFQERQSFTTFFGPAGINVLMGFLGLLFLFYLVAVPILGIPEVFALAFLDLPVLFFGVSLLGSFRQESRQRYEYPEIDENWCGR